MTITCRSEVNFLRLKKIYFKKVNLINVQLSVSDPRVDSWMMMKSPMKTIGFMFAYLVSIRLIREHMANRKPFELRKFLIIYNFFQVCGSFYIFSEVCLSIFVIQTCKKLLMNIFNQQFKLLLVAYLSNYSLVCQPVDYSNDPLAMRVCFNIFFFDS